MAEPGTRRAGTRRDCRPGYSFDPQHFLTGARGAYEMIVLAFADGDRRALKNLLSRKCMKASMPPSGTARSKSEDRDAVRLDRQVRDDRRGAARPQGAAHGALRLADDLGHPRQDRQVVDGNPDKVADITDVWTFARDISSRDPNWKLVATGSAALICGSRSGASRCACRRPSACCRGCRSPTGGAPCRSRHARPADQASHNAQAAYPRLECRSRSTAARSAARMVRIRRLGRGRSSRRLQDVSRQLQADRGADAAHATGSEAARRSLREPCRAARAPRFPTSAKARAFFEENFVPLQISRLGEGTAS